MTAPGIRTPVDMRPAVGSVWRHYKRGGVYEVTGFCMLEKEWALAVLYRPIGQPDSVPIAREHREFLDGRFEEMPSAVKR
jgi:hypothetical protein